MYSVRCNSINPVTKENETWLCTDRNEELLVFDTIEDANNHVEMLKKIFVNNASFKVISSNISISIAQKENILNVIDAYIKLKKRDNKSLLCISQKTIKRMFR